jgi:uracil-DNA glycosylase
VQAHLANSHSKIGWQKFTDRVIRVIDESLDGVVFILLGSFAQKKGWVFEIKFFYLKVYIHFYSFLYLRWLCKQS